MARDTGAPALALKKLEILSVNPRFKEAEPRPEEALQGQL
jgi:hypothetical protein